MDNLPAFEIIYDESRHLVYNLALHYLQQPADAQDATQEIFVKIYRHLNKYDPYSASLKTWVYRITVNHCLDHIRSKKSKKRFAFITGLFDKETVEHSPIHFDHPGISLEHKEELRELFELINQLPPKQKTALLLTKLESRSQNETAAIMQISAKAVESLLQRAKQTLAKKMEQKGRIS